MKSKIPKKGIIARPEHEHPLIQLIRRYDIPRNLGNETKIQQIATSPQCELKLVDDILE